MHRAKRGLLPRRPGAAFEHAFKFDGTIPFDGSATFGPSAQNAVHYHQLGTSDSAGISTTPHLDRARHYATSGKGQPGVVYVIDRAKLAGLGVREHVVADTV